MARVVSTSKRFTATTATTITTIMTRDSFISTKTVAVVDVAAAVAAAVAESSVDLSAAPGTETGTGTGTGPGSRWSAYSTLEDQSQEQPVSRARLWWGAQGPRVFFFIFVFIVFGLAVGEAFLLLHYL